MSRWDPVSPRKPDRWRNAAGCYVILLDGLAIYVGQSENVRRRITKHGFENYAGLGDIRDGYCSSPWGDIHWSEGTLTAKVKYARRFGEQLMVEARLIRRLRPRFNIRGIG